MLGLKILVGTTMVVEKGGWTVRTLGDDVEHTKAPTWRANCRGLLPPAMYLYWITCQGTHGSTRDTEVYTGSGLLRVIP
jgi:hypothetical protein